MEDIRSHTALRGVASLLVVLSHFGSLLEPEIYLEHYTVAASRGYLWVDLFFLLSGYILCHVYGDVPGTGYRQALSFFWARFARIFPLHFLTLFFLVVWQYLILRFTHQESRVGEASTFWLNLLNIHAWGFLDRYDWNFPSWSISAEMAAYFSFPIICMGHLRAPRLTRAVLGTAIAILIVYLILVDSRLNWERIVLFRSFPMFFLGTFLYGLRPKSQIVPTTVLSCIQCFAAISIAIGLHYGWNDAMFVAPFALLVFATQTDKGVLSCVLVTRPLVFLGQWSYSIYMLHISVRLVLSMVWPKVFGQSVILSPWVGKIAFFSVAVMTTLVIGAFSYNFFETPTRRYLRSYFPAIGKMCRRT